MGRSTHNFLAGALGFYPLAKAVDAGASAIVHGPRWQYPLQSGEPIFAPAAKNHFGKYLQHHHQNGWDYQTLPTGRDQTYYRFIGSPNILGWTWSAELITEVTDTKIRMESRSDGAGQVATDTQDTDVAAGTNPTGIIKGAFVSADTAETGPNLHTRVGTGAASTKLVLPAKTGFAVNATTGTSDAINGLAGNTFGCPSAFYDSVSDTYAFGGNKNVGSHSTGMVIGAMTTFVLHDVSAGTSENALRIRKFRAPFDMRVLKVTYGCAGSAAGNSVRLFNATKSLNIDSPTNLIAAGSVEKDPNDDSFFRADDNRNINFNDTLTLEVTTGGTAGYTNLWCMVTCVTTGTPYGGLDNARIWAYWNGQVNSDLTQAEGERGVGMGPTKHLSGPAIGAPISLYIGGKDSSASATNEAQQSIIAPFDMDVYHVAVFQHDGDTGSASTMKVRNTTLGVDLIDHLDSSSDSTPTTSTRGNSTFTIVTRRVNRGDVLTVTTTTTGTALVFAGAVICGISRGFPYPNAALD